MRLAHALLFASALVAGANALAIDLPANTEAVAARGYAHASHKPSKTPPGPPGPSATPGGGESEGSGEWNGGKHIYANGCADTCLAVKDGKLEKGQPVVVAKCSDVPEQSWDIHRGNGALRLKGTDWCVEAADDPAAKDKVKLWRCYPGIAAQSWLWGDDNSISLPDQGLCLDLTDGVKTPGTPVQTFKCFPGNTNQIWTTNIKDN
ncbi:hypothetical protein Q8F55_007241 [Vanrija albida]|uniref:Ricin B lectin domain-containing protein n=1 Tax=Vanrija albida TaxID=181172 RepID=A0ABR3PZV3_9TREE